MKKPFTIKPLRKYLALSSTAFMLITVISSHSAFAQIDAATAAELRAQIQALSARLEQLENANIEMTDDIEQTQVAMASAPATSASWTDSIKISGDFRPRYENHDDESAASDRNRNRMRARLNISADVNDDWSVALGLASGGTDPISTNQTFGGGSSTKDIRLDYAYFSYQGFDNTAINVGKYKNVFFKPGGQNLIYDGDFRPEGLALKYDNSSLFFNAATMILESDDKASSQDKESMWGLQAGYEMTLDNGSFTIGASYYDASVAGSQPFYNNKSYRNSLDGSGAYLFNYEEVELFAEARFSLGEQPLRLFADYVQNMDADDYDTGWLVGAKYGDVDGAGTWEFGYNYQDLEADAVYGAFTDSDYSGGGTDSSGHVIKAAYGLGENVEAGFTYYINEYGEASQGQTIDYNRLHLEMVLKF